MLTDKNIENLKRRVDKLKQARRRDEKETCKRLIVPTLRLLEWDDSDEDMVEDEYRIPGLQNDSKGRVDYALFAKRGEPAVLVEAKKLGNLGDWGVKQLKQYGLKHIIERGTGNLAFLVLTDGNVWQFHPLSPTKGLAHYGDWCYALNLEKDNTSEIRDGLNNLLDRQRVIGGESSKYLEKLFRLQRIDQVLWPILSGMDEALVDLVESKMANSGHELKREEIKEVIQACLVPRLAERSDIKKDAESSPGRDVNSEGSNTKKTKFQVTYGGKIVEGRNPTVVMGNVLALFADACGIDRLIRACIDSDETYPTVMTDEKAHEVEKTAKKRPLTEPLPRYSGYSYLAGYLYNDDKRDRLNELAKQLGISDRVKIDFVQDDGDKTKRGKTKELEVKWDDKEFKGKDKTRVMGDVIAEFANIFGIDAVAKKCTELGQEVPTVMAEAEVDKYKEVRESIRCKEISGHPKYVYLANLSGEDNANRVKLLGEALGITQFEVKLDGKLHR